MNIGFDETSTVCILVGNYSRHWMLLLMVFLCSSVSCQDGQVYLMRSSKEGEFFSPISCPSGSIVVVMCHDDHQKMKGFLIGHGSWDFTPHLMIGGGATHIMATWCVLTSGVNAPIVWLLGFLLNFSFCALIFKLPFFSLSPSLSPTSNHFSELLLLQPISAIFFKPVHSVVELSMLFWGMPFFFPFFLCHRYRLCSVSDFSFSFFLFVLVFGVFRIHLFSTVFWLRTWAFLRWGWLWWFLLPLSFELMNHQSGLSTALSCWWHCHLLEW